MKIGKKLLSSILVLSMLFTNLAIVKADSGMSDEKIRVPEGTFERKSEILSDFVSKSDGGTVTNEDGSIILSKKDDGDHHALLNNGERYKSFIYEADVKIIDGISAGLVIGVDNPDNVPAFWYAVNFNTEGTDEFARLFKVAGDVTNYTCISKDEATSKIDFTQTVHMYVEVD